MKKLFSVVLVLALFTSLCYADDLFNAISEGNLDQVKKLLTESPDLLKATLDDGSTPLHRAAYEGKLEITAFLLEAGADIMAQKVNQSTPLHGAAFYGHPEVAKLLVEKGADPNFGNEANFTPLLSAGYAKQTEIVKYLLSKGANPNIMNSWGYSLLHFAAESGDMQTVKHLMKEGAKIDIRSEDSYPPLVAAIHGQQIEMVKFLLSEGANVHLNFENGTTSLAFAVFRSDPELVKLLLEEGASPNILEDENRSLLQSAVLQGNPEVVDLLVKAGAEVDYPEKRSGKTALHFASINGNDGATESLLANDANYKKKDLKGNTALYYAGKYGHHKVADLLKKSGAKCKHLDENYGYSADLTKDFDNGEAVLWYMGHCGWGIKTKNHFLVFDYWSRGNEPPEPLLANGRINPAELAGQNVEVFATHEHQDHFDKAIFEWSKGIDDITYIYGFVADSLPQYRETGYDGPGYIYTAPRDQKTVDGMEIVTLRANDAGVGFLVKVDGLTIYHAGDHAGWLEGQKDGYTSEIDYISQYADEVDFAFLNVSGCHTRDKCALDEGNDYTISKLKPRFLVPTHALNSEYKYTEYMEHCMERDIDVDYICAENRGDKYHYVKGKLLSYSK